MKHFKEYINQMAFILGDSKKYIPFLIFFFLISSLFDLIGIGLIIPFISVIISPEGPITEKFNYFFGFFNIAVSYKDLILFVGISMLITFTFKALASIFVYKKILKFCFNQGIYIRKYLMRSYQALPYLVFLERNSSEYIYNLQHVVELYYREVLQSFLKLVSELFVVFFIVILLAWYDISALILLVSLIFGSIFIYDRIFKSKLASYGEKVNQNSIQMVKGVAEGINGLKEIRILGKESFFYNLVRTSSEKHANASSNSEIISNLPRYFLETILIYFVVILSFIAHFIDNNLVNILPTLSLFAIAALRLSPSANTIINCISKIRFGRDSVNLLYQDMMLLNKFEFDNSQILKTQNQANFHSLELKNIDFSFPKSNRKILQNISIKINSGDAIGIMGPSGSGKTTLVDLILGLLNPDSGDIFFNNRSEDSEILSIKNQIAYLPQQVFIIDDSVANNIALGVENDEIDLMKLKISIRTAQLTKTIDEMSNGINTKLGEKGVRLSGGERQRISLARAFYHDKNILIMDESTSALDSEVEREIVEEVKRLKKDKTIIVIAHRLSTLKYCDCIYQIEDGKIVKSGNYDEMVLNKSK